MRCAPELHAVRMGWGQFRRATVGRRLLRAMRHTLEARAGAVRGRRLLCERAEGGANSRTGIALLQFN